MDELVKEVITYILTEMKPAWNEDDTLNMGFIEHEYTKAMDTIFVYDILMAGYWRAAHLFRLFFSDVVDPDELEKDPEAVSSRDAHFEWSKADGGWLLCQCNDYNCPANWWSDKLSAIVDRRSAKKQDSWPYYAPPQEEIEALGVKRPLSYGKVVGKNYQPTLF